MGYLGHGVSEAVLFQLFVCVTDMNDIDMILSNCVLCGAPIDRHETLVCHLHSAQVIYYLTQTFMKNTRTVFF